MFQWDAITFCNAPPGCQGGWVQLEQSDMLEALLIGCNKLRVKGNRRWSWLLSRCFDNTKSRVYGEVFLGCQMHEAIQVMPADWPATVCVLPFQDKNLFGRQA